MKSRRELLKMLPFLAAIPFVRIPNENNVIRNWRSYPEHLTVTLRSKQTNEWDQFVFPSRILEMHDTPMGIHVRCEDGLYLISTSGPRPENWFVHKIAGIENHEGK